jgi:oxygen tolerance protein BatD
MLAGIAVMAQLAIVAHAPDTVATCDAVEVSVAVSARGAVIPRLTSPSFAPFDVLRSSAPRIEYGSRARSSVMVEYRFTVTTDRTGRFVIPPFEASIGAERVRSRALPIVVRPALGQGTPAVFTRARVDTSSDLNLRATSVAAAETVFVGQQATYEVAVFLNQPVRDRLRRNPTFYPPEMQAMLAYDLPAPSATARKRVGSQCFDALVYRRALFPLVAGKVVIPPAQLIYSTGLASTSLFSREESHEIQTDSVTIVALDPPGADRPAEYSGAVGNLTIEARVDSARARVGDAMLFTVRVAGSGNVKLFPRPSLAIPWAALVAADERVRVDSTNPRISGSKEFDWVLTPRIAGEFDLPPTRYGYFDPVRQRYDVAVAPPTPVHIDPGTLAVVDTAQAEGPLAIRTRYGGPAWPPIHSHPAFWALMAMAPLPAIVRRARRREAAKAKARSPARDPVRALALVKPDDAVALRRVFVRTLAQRLGCSPEDFTHPGALERALRRAGVSDRVATQAELLLRDLDSAAYGGRDTRPSRTSDRAVTIARAVDREALDRRELPFWIPLIVLAATLSVAATALATDAASSLFARGVSAYLRHDYQVARASFADAVTAAPTAPDAWANYGTASWTVGDTAAAVFGWRQALAIEPSAEDLQARLSTVRSGSLSDPGWVPAVPRNAMSFVFAFLWLAAWFCAWVASRRTSVAPEWTSRAAMPLAACAVLVGLVSIEVQTRTTGARLAVVRRTATLTSAPAIGMDRGPNVGNGEIVRIVGRRGTWTRVEAAGDRDGWIAAPLLAPLDQRHPLRN